MKAILIAGLMAMSCLFLVAGPEPSPVGGEETAKEQVVLCGGCGEVKGGEACCKADAKKCGHCQLSKGSPGCCNMEKGKDAKLCACGEVAGGESCCKMEGREKCGHCKKLKGSPGCKMECGGHAKKAHSHGGKKHTH